MKNDWKCLEILPTDGATVKSRATLSNLDDPTTLWTHCFDPNYKSWSVAAPATAGGEPDGVDGEGGKALLFGSAE